MNPVVGGLIALLFGGAVGFAVATLIWMGRARRTEIDALQADHVLVAISQLRSAAAVVNAQGSVLAASPLARGAGLVRGSHLADPAVAALVAEAAAAKDSRFRELQLNPGPGRPSVRLAVRVVPLPDGTAIILGEDRSAEDRYDETRRDFVANVTHELKTPIGAILLLAEAIESAASDPEAVVIFTGKIAGEADRLNELVSQIIALSRLQSSDPLLAATPVGLDRVVSEAVARCRQLAERKSISITATPGQGITVVGDAEQLETALANLVQNAVAYSEPGARVVIAQTCPDEDTVELRVSDTGIGIAADDLDRIFERFYRVDRGRSRAHGGTGLGLSIVKHVVTAHGGTVTAWSKPGQGSTFTIRLPRRAADAPASR